MNTVFMAFPEHLHLYITGPSGTVYCYSERHTERGYGVMVSPAVRPEDFDWMREFSGHRDQRRRRQQAQLMDLRQRRQTADGVAAVARADSTAQLVELPRQLRELTAQLTSGGVAETSGEEPSGSGRRSAEELVTRPMDSKLSMAKRLRTACER